MGKKKTLKRDKHLRDFYIKLHNLTNYGVAASTEEDRNLAIFDLHHVIEFSESEEHSPHVKKEYVDHVGNVILLDRDIHRKLSEGTDSNNKFYELEFFNKNGTDYVLFKNIINSQKSKDYFEYNNGQKEFENGKDVLFDPVLIPFMKKYNEELNRRYVNFFK